MESRRIQKGKGETSIATLKEEFEALKIKVAAAMAKGDQAALNEKVHVVFHSAEKKRKATNPTGATRVMLNCRTPDQWKEFQMEKERYFEVGVDPHLAIDLMIRALSSFSEERLREWVQQGHTEHPGPPPAEPLPGDEWFEPKEELPDFLRD